MIRLGFPVRILGQPTLRAYDGRRGGTAHLSVSLVYLRDVLLYLQRIGVRYYRVAPLLMPCAADDALAQIEECTAELAAIAAQVVAQGTRLTLHLRHEVAPGGDDRTRAGYSLAEIEVQALLLEHLEAGLSAERCPQAIMVVHIGGAGRSRAALERFATRYQALSPRARARLAVEHDPGGFSLGSLLWLHQRCGVPVVFDYLHWVLDNPERLPLDLALGLALGTWPVGVRPEVHLSTPRSEAHLVVPAAGQPARVLPPRPGQHADFIAVTDLLHLLHAARGLPDFDLMLEAKAGDLALLRLREEISRIAPDLAGQLG